MNKIPIISLEEAASKVRDGNRVMVGGFGMTGNPVHLLHTLANSAIKNLIYISNNIGEEGLGGGRLLRNGQIKKVIGSFLTSNPEAVKAFHGADIEVQLIPQGTFVEAIRAGGAGIGGFYTPTAVGTELGDGETRSINGKKQLFVPSMRANVAFIRAWKADRAGNLQYRYTDQNFNKAMASAADLVIAEVNEIVEIGELEASEIHTPGHFIDYLVEVQLSAENLGFSSGNSRPKKLDKVRKKIAERAYKELSRGDLVNLGVGIPTLVANFIHPDDGITLHSENGMIGVGPAPKTGDGLHFPVNAGKQPVTELSGSSYFDSADSFGLIRGGHVDIAIMGALQVDENANLANWSAPGKSLLGVGGAMDLAIGAGKIIVTMFHSDNQGNAKIVPKCTLPLTALAEVDLIITDLAIFNFKQGKLTLTDIMPGVSLDEVKSNTEAKFAIAKDLL